MHEVGLVSGILEVAVRTAREAGASRVVSVTVRIGDMCEVVRESLDFAWEALREEDPLTENASLVVVRVAPRSVCAACGAQFEHDRFHCRCPECGSGQTTCIAGREMDIVSLDVDIPDDDTDAEPCKCAGQEATHEGTAN